MVNLQLYILFLGSLSIIPLFVGGLLFNYSLTEDYESIIFAKLNTINKNIEYALETNLDAKSEFLYSISSRTQLRIEWKNYQNTNDLDSLNKIKEILSDLKNETLHSNEVYLFDNEKKILFGQSNSNIDPTNGKNLGNFFLDFIHDGKNKGIFSKPVFHDNELLGYVTIISEISTLSSDFNKFEETGETIIAIHDKYGLIHILSNHEKLDSHIHENDFSNLPILSALHNEERNFENVLDYKGDIVFANSNFLEKYGIGIVVKQNSDEIFEILNLTKQKGFFTVLLIYAIIIFFSFIMSRELIKPINTLNSKLTSAKNYRFDPVDARGPKEIRMLQNSYNDLMRALRDSELSKKELSKNLFKLETEKIDVIRKLSINIAHDLKNPLTSILNSLIILRSEKEGKIMQKEIERIQKNTMRMKYQIDNFLEYIKTQNLVITDVSLLELSKDVCYNLKIPSNVEVIFPKSELIFKADEEKMYAALSNIIKNAINSIDKMNGKIKIAGFKENGFVRILISNTGPSIPIEVLDKLFEPLYTTKSFGMGLGLSSVKTIIEAHNGDVLVNNNPVTFTIILPQNEGKKQ